MNVKTIPGIYQKVNWSAFSALVIAASIGISMTMSALDVDTTPDAPNSSEWIQSHLLALKQVQAKSPNANEADAHALKVNGKVLGAKEEYIDVQVVPGTDHIRLHVQVLDPTVGELKKTKHQVLLAADVPKRTVSWGEGQYVYLKGYEPGHYRIAVRQMVISRNVHGQEQLFTQDIAGTLQTIGGCLRATQGCVLAVSRPQYLAPLSGVQEQLGQAFKKAPIEQAKKILQDQRGVLLQSSKEALWTIALGALLIRLGALRVIPQLGCKKNKVLRASALKV